MLIRSYIIQFLEMTSWRMYQPHLYGFMHVCALVGTVLLALFFALFLRNTSEKKKLRLITSLGWVMVVMELYKQLFYYFIVYDRMFDWWFFPFQLCSVPMYLCVLLPFVKKDIRDVFLTFMAGFTFVSALAALIYPEDMLKPYIMLTAHGFIWHGILLFISLLIGISGMADLSFRGFMRSAVFFLGLAVIAVLINVIAEPVAASNPLVLNSAEGPVPGAGGISYPNMFYLSPFHASGQPFVNIIEAKYGRPLAMAAYTLSVIGLAGIADLIFSCVSHFISKK